MTPPEIIRALYGVHAAPASARGTVERLVREFGAAIVLRRAQQTTQELGWPEPHEQRPLEYLDALCRVEAARERRWVSA